MNAPGLAATALLNQDVNGARAGDIPGNQKMTKLSVVDLGLQNFADAFAIQEETVAARQAGNIPDTLILVEHTPVYTLGRNADEANVIYSAESLQTHGIELVRTTRGGQVTYHGPGQLVGYPVINLRERKQGVLWYVEQLENMLIETLKACGIESEAGRKDRGVWIGDNKIAALGVRVTRHVTMHGFALNVAVNLDDYSGIIPCGIRDKGVTSLHCFKPDITIEAVKQILIDSFCNVFDYGEVELAVNYSKRD
jgi:lipoyl(octanoyl) transferase